MAAGHEPAMCTHSPESQACPGLHPKLRVSRARERICPSGLLCETSPGVLHPEYRRDMDLLEYIQRRDTKMTRKMEHLFKRTG